ncbi:hypothetical protein JJQ72_02795 [Paenibacillus sp. F411]|uniref:hypothetical protein n=1 Tax=Paenibacillus sp. F411 TaxID=2820239 RepID=UPI001AAF69D8|nr:hypothetical protein [Paenibacillus sp. F411]MBO2942905.1 hypothetical protein [Paenibacillus sp. F411]
MMKIKLFHILICASLLVLILSSCQTSNQSDMVGVSKESKELETFYPSDITLVDSIEIMSGDNGTKKTTTDQVLIQEWIEKVRHLKIILDPDREDSSGVLFHVTMLEQGEKKLYMTPININHYRMETQSELADRMTELYDSIK